MNIIKKHSEWHLWCFRLWLSKISKQKLSKNPEYGVFFWGAGRHKKIFQMGYLEKDHNITMFWFPVCFTLISYSYRCQSYSSRTTSTDTLVPNKRVGSDTLWCRPDTCFQWGCQVFSGTLSLSRQIPEVLANRPLRGCWLYQRWIRGAQIVWTLEEMRLPPWSSAVAPQRDSRLDPAICWLLQVNENSSRLMTPSTTPFTVTVNSIFRRLICLLPGIELVCPSADTFNVVGAQNGSFVEERGGKTEGSVGRVNERGDAMLWRGASFSSAICFWFCKLDALFVSDSSHTFCAARRQQQGARHLFQRTARRDPSHSTNY